MVPVMGQAANLTNYLKGFRLGMERGQREMLRFMLEVRFGQLPKPAKDCFESLPADELRDLGRALLHAKALADLGLEDPTGP